MAIGDVTPPHAPTDVAYLISVLDLPERDKKTFLLESLEHKHMKKSRRTKMVHRWVRRLSRIESEVRFPGHFTNVQKGPNNREKKRKG